MRKTTFFLLLSQIVVSCSLPNFETEAEPLGPAEESITIPIFRVPYADYANPLKAIFVDVSNPNETALHLVWKDEDHPIKLFDYAYDADRWWGLFQLSTSPPFFQLDFDSDGFHRIADVETISYTSSNEIKFDSTYSGSQKFNTLIAVHHSTILNISDFEIDNNDRPIIYINTWNHMMSNIDNNPRTRKINYIDVPLYKGTRADIQTMFENIWTDFGLNL